MRLTITKQILLLSAFALLAACSTQDTSRTGNQSGGLLGGQQSASGSQSGGLLGGQQSSSGSQSGGLLGGQQSTPGSQNSAGRQSIPGSQLIGQQNRNTMCVDKATGKPIPGCKATTTLAQANLNKAKKLPSTPAKTSKMRKIVLKAPKKTIPAKTLSKPTVAKPTMAKPFNRSTVKKPLPQIRPRSTTTGNTANKPATVNTSPFTPIRPARPALSRPASPLRRPAPVRKPVVTQPRSRGIIANPVRSAKPPARPAQPVVKPVVRARAPAPVVKKPKSTMRRLTLNGSANFKSGSSRLTSKGQTKLLAMSLSLQEGNTQISRLLIEGHTDSVGNAAMNQVLSLKRANAVAEYLAKKGGFARSMMETVGHGENKPIASNKTRKGRAQNRRVEISATGTRSITR